MPRRSTKATPASPASPLGHSSLGLGHSAAPGGSSLHPALAAWFSTSLGTPTPAQAATLPHILAGRSVLLSSPTGTGKTLAAFLGVFDHLQRLHESDTLPAAGIVALYVSPLRALAYDLQKNLHAPLEQLGWSHLRVAARTGDTTPKERAAQRKKPPHILVTTPESLTLLLSQPAWAAALGTVRFLIIDELHALAENKRGALLALAAERLESLVHSSGSSLPAPRPPLVRIGLSATASPLPELARFLTGPSRHCEIIEILPAPATSSESAPTGHSSFDIRHSALAVSVFSPLAANPYPAAGYTAVRILRELAEELTRHRTTLIFTNTRAGAESIGLRLKQLLPDLAPLIEVHHASLDRAVRLEVEDRLKRGELRAVVCSTSLELGIDIGSIDLVVMISAPKGVARALQRVGRSGHAPGRSARGLLVATNLNDLAECAATIRLMRARALEPLRFPQNPADVLAQHLVGIAVTVDTAPDEAFALVRQAHPYQHLPRDTFDRILHYLQGGGRSLEKAYAHLFGKIILTPDGYLAIPSPRIVREFYQNIGTIASEAHVTVKLGARNLGTVEESFLKGLRPGDTFVLNARCVRLVSTTLLTAKVKPAAPSELPTVPRWNANKMPLASGLAAEVVRLRTAVADLLNADPAHSAAPAIGHSSFDIRHSSGAPPGAAEAYLQTHYEFTPANASALIRHFRLQAAVSRIPVATSLLVETCTEPASGLVHHFFHTLIGRSANDALSRIVALRIRRAFGGNALVTLDDYGFLLTLRPFQSLTSAETIRPLLARAGAESDLAEALADSELVKWQFRGVAQAGLLVPRRVGGAERGSRSLQWSAEILFDVLRRHEPDHPILAEAYAEATTRFLDLPAALAFLDTAAALPIDLVPLPRVSPFAFGLYASRIKETMTLEDPETTLERLYHEMYSHLVP